VFTTRYGLDLNNVFHCHLSLKAVQSLRQLISCLLPRRRGFDTRWVYVRFEVERWHWDRFFSESFGFSLSVPFHYCSTLISIYLLLLPERQTGEAWDLCQCCLTIKEASDRNAFPFSLSSMYGEWIKTTAWSTVLLEKLTGLQLVKEFPAFYGTRRFITAFTGARHLSLSWASSIQSIPLNPHPEDSS